MSEFQLKSPREIAADEWTKSAPSQSIPLDMRPTALATRRFPLRMNHYDAALIEMVSRLEHASKQQTIMRIVRATCEARLKRAGLDLPR